MNSTEESSCASPEASIEPSIAKRFIKSTPDLSSLLALAIADLGRVQSDPRYVLDIRWSIPDPLGHPPL
jgi:hypothetical protein